MKRIALFSLPLLAILVVGLGILLRTQLPALRPRIAGARAAVAEAIEEALE